MCYSSRRNFLYFRIFSSITKRSNKVKLDLAKFPTFGALIAWINLVDFITFQEKTRFWVNNKNKINNKYFSNDFLNKIFIGTYPETCKKIV